MPIHIFLNIGGRGNRTSHPARSHASGPAISSRSGTVPLALAADFTYIPSSDVGSLFAHREREPQPETHRAHENTATVGARRHKLELRRHSRSVFGRRERSSTMARGGAVAPTIDGTCRCEVTVVNHPEVEPPLTMIPTSTTLDYPTLPN